MERIILAAAGAALMVGLFMLEQHFESEQQGYRAPRQIRLAADPSLKYQSEESPYMRSER